MTQIISTIDYNIEGKQVGWLRLPHSITRSAYGTIAIPIALLSNGKGPKILLTAGNHGDEYEGQIVLTRLIKELQSEEISGQLFILPALNLPAVITGKRVSPIDNGNLNRLFPGNPNGTPTEMIADYVENHLLTRVDVVVDFHCGGASLDYRPHASAHISKQAEPEHKIKNIEAAKALGLEHVMIFERNPEVGKLPDAAMRKGVISLGGEFGGSASVKKSYVRLVENAVSNVLAYFEMTRKVNTKPSFEPQILAPANANDLVYADERGLFEPATELGDFVNSGDLCGSILFPENPSRKELYVYFETSGYVVCKRHLGRVEPGDCVAHLARKLPVKNDLRTD
ncbi:MAG: succinylglutamate desuccinylase/aspartoacylase family protein [Paracoccaceae bacterium]|nr:succinylglutamate desuccinylase/aspartoacylase family protein [Paracoccaceae bacterium]